MGIFEDAGFELPKPRSAAKASKESGRSIFEEAGFELPKAAGASMPAAASPPADLPPGAADVVQVPGGGRSYIDAAGRFVDGPGNSPAPTLDERRMAYGRDIGDRWLNALSAAWQGSRGMTSEGGGDIRRSMPAAGVGKIGLGLLGQLSSPITAALNVAGEEIDKATGAPGTGERLALVAGAPKGVTTAARALPTSQGMNALVRAIGPENVPAAVARMRANPQLSVVDVSDPVRTMTQGLIDPAQPRAQDIIAGAVKRRMNEGPAVVNSAYTESMGAAPDTVKLVNSLKERAAKVGREEIQPALEKAGHVDVSPVIQAIDKELWPAVQGMKSGVRMSPAQEELARLRLRLVSDNGEMLFDPQRLHEIQSETGRNAFQLFNSSSGQDRLVAGRLRAANEKLVDAIDAASGGKYRPARERFAEAKDIDEAFQKGFDVLKNRSGVAGLEDRPEALREWMKTATPEQLIAKRLGARSDIDQKIRGVKNQVLAGTNITKIEYNREKLETLFGKDEAGRLVRAMNDAADVAQTNAKLVAGSKTAETLAGQKALNVPKVGGGNPLAYVTPVAAELLGQSAGFPLVGGLGVAALKGAHLGIQKVQQMNALARNRAFARAATATGSEREDVIRQLMAHPKVARPMRGNALAASP